MAFRSYLDLSPDEGFFILMDVELISGRFETLDGRVSEAQLRLENLSVNDRFKAALKRLMIAWGLALAFVPIPGIHFIAVPGFLIGGVFAAFSGFGIKSRLADVRGHCPQCCESLAFGRMARRDRLKEHCPQCRANLYLVTRFVAKKQIDS